jgi:hypothetical protein
MFPKTFSTKIYNLQRLWLNLLLEELEKQAAETGQPVERYDLTLELLRQAIEKSSIVNKS